jgi:hypothetical protein
MGCDIFVTRGLFVLIDSIWASESVLNGDRGFD